MIRSALLVGLAVAGCSVDVAVRPELPPVTDSDRYDPAQDVIEADRESEGEALQIALGYYRANVPGLAEVEIDPGIRVGWVAGVECEELERPGERFIDNGSWCSNGVTYSCDRMFAVLRDDQTIAQSPYAHELLHCVLRTAGVDDGHSGAFFRHAAAASAAIAVGLDR